MPWKACDLMSLRLELMALAQQPGVDRSALARRYGISRKTLYKWLNRFDGQDPAVLNDPAALADRSRRPRHSPNQTDPQIEAHALAIRHQHPAWGPRKIHAVMARSLPAQQMPSVSSIGRILRRHDCIAKQASQAAERYQRFEHPHPNDLWQMDFKGDFSLAGGGRCHPLTILDDHSRYNLLLAACANQRMATVLEHLMAVFRRYGLPQRMLMDNGSPWGVGHDPDCYTRLEVQLMSLDIAVSHGRPYHPQTQGKEERFHRTLKVELLQQRQLLDLPDAQRAFDPWRQMYNHQRPHEALGLATPASRYAASCRGLPQRIEPPDYHEHDRVRSVNPVGQMHLHGRTYKLTEAFAGRRVAVRPTASDGLWSVHFGRFRIALLDERDASVKMVRT
jgi:transposase InsO family protein